MGNPDNLLCYFLPSKTDSADKKQLCTSTINAAALTKELWKSVKRERKVKKQYNTGIDEVVLQDKWADHQKVEKLLTTGMNKAPFLLDSVLGQQLPRLRWHER